MFRPCDFITRLILVKHLKRYIWAGYVAGMGERRGVYAILVGKPEGNRPLGRPRRTVV